MRQEIGRGVDNLRPISCRYRHPNSRSWARGAGSKYEGSMPLVASAVISQPAPYDPKSYDLAPSTVHLCPVALPSSHQTGGTENRVPAPPDGRVLHHSDAKRAAGRRGKRSGPANRPFFGPVTHCVYCWVGSPLGNAARSPEPSCCLRDCSSDSTPLSAARAANSSSILVLCSSC